MAPPAARPTRARHWVIVFAVSLGVLAYFDRTLIMEAAPYMRDDLDLDEFQMGSIFSAFALAYALFEVPAGWLGDWKGPRRVLAWIVLWWSAFTVLTGAMWNGLSLWVTRFLFGAGQAGCFPNLTKSFTTWLPEHERLRAQGVMWGFARWGGAFTPPIAARLLRMMKWRWVFVVFGAAGALWVWLFWRWYRDNPGSHPSVNEAEMALLAGAEERAQGHGNVPWGRFLRSRTVWLLWIQYAFLAFPWYFYITWLTTYLEEGRGVERGATGWYAIFPLLFGGVGDMFCGLISSRVERLFGTGLGRRLLGTAGFVGAACFMALAIQMDSVLAAMLAMGMASFCNDLVMPPAWGACMDVGGNYAGSLAGSMNMMGNLGGATAPVVGGAVVRYMKGIEAAASCGVAVPRLSASILVWAGSSWNVFLYIMAIVYAVGALCWPFIHPVEGEVETS